MGALAEEGGSGIVQEIEDFGLWGASCPCYPEGPDGSLRACDGVPYVEQTCHETLLRNNMRFIDFRIPVAGDIFGFRAIVMFNSDPPTVVVADVAFRYRLWPVDYISAVLTMDDFLDIYCVEEEMGRQEAIHDLYDEAFITACHEEGEDYDSWQVH